MSIATLHVLHGIKNNTTFLSQMSNAQASAGIEPLLGVPAGTPFPTFVGNPSQTPEITFDSTQLKTILDACGTSIADWSANNTILYFKKVSPFASRVGNATAQHMTLSAAEAALLWSQISADHQQPASASCNVGIIYDGTNEPLIPVNNVVVTGTSTSEEHYTVGTIWINGTQIHGIQNVQISSGVSVFHLGGDGELYKTFIAEQEANPTITFQTPDLPWPTIGLNGLAASSFSVYLRKIGTTAPVPDGTAEHIKFSGTKGLIRIEQTVNGANNETMTTVTITPVGTAENTRPLTVNTAIAITN